MKKLFIGFSLSALLLKEINSQCAASCATCSFTNPNFCYTCAPGFNPKYPDSNGFCRLCYQIVALCSSCIVQSGVTKCQSCGNYPYPNQPTYPNAERNQCQRCTDFINGCSTCTVTSGVATCLTCNSDLYLNSDGTQCKTCPEFIPGCSTCTVTSGVATCLTCNSDLYLNSDGTQCKTCPEFIPGCSTCTVTSGVATCQDCDSYLVPSTNGDSCVQPCQISRCITCWNIGKDQICSECVENDPVTGKPLVLAPNLKSCIQCSQGYYYRNRACIKCPTPCQTCHIDRGIICDS